MTSLKLALDCRKLPPANSPERVSRENQIQKHGHAMLEMPTGAGKTVCLIAVCVAYKMRDKISGTNAIGKLVFTTRTVNQVNKFTHELEKLVKHRWTVDKTRERFLAFHEAQRQTEGHSAPAPELELLGVAMSSRQNLCINETVTASCTTGDEFNSACRRLLFTDMEDVAGAGAGRSGCHYHQPDHYSMLPNGVYTLPDLKAACSAGGQATCPYYQTRAVLRTGQADVVVCAYQYLLDPRIAVELQPVIPANSVIVFDEGHNIEMTAMQELSIHVTRFTLDKAYDSLRILSGKIKQQSDRRWSNLRSRFIREVQTRAANDHSEPPPSLVDAATYYARQILTETMPGSMRKQSQFITHLRRVIEYLKLRMTRIEAETARVEATGYFIGRMASSQDGLGDGVPRVDEMKHLPDRLLMLLWELQEPETGPYHSLLSVCYLMGMAAAHDHGFKVIVESPKHRLEYIVGMADEEDTIARTLAQGGTVATDGAGAAVGQHTGDLGYREPRHAMFLASDVNGEIVDVGISEEEHILARATPVIQLVCLDPHIAIKPLLDFYRNVIVTSGTLSPRPIMERLVGMTGDFAPVVSASFDATLARPTIRPIVISRTSDQSALTSSYQARGDSAVIKGYGYLVERVCHATPDGVVVFFPSYRFMDDLLNHWEAIKILDGIKKSKLLFIERPDPVETRAALAAYDKACDSGRGAVLLAVARGKVSEGVDFAHHRGRAAVVIGVPFPFTMSPVYQQRLKYLADADHANVPERDYIAFDAIRATAQCVGRVVRGKDDYGAVILADSRYTRTASITKFPGWIRAEMREAGISTDMAHGMISRFLGSMGPPLSIEHQMRAGAVLDGKTAQGYLDENGFWKDDER